MTKSKLVDKLDGIIDGYYKYSDDHALLADILEEVDFLYTQGMLDYGFGRFHDIIANGGLRLKTNKVKKEQKMTVEEFAESLARFVGRNVESDILNMQMGIPSWNINADKLMDCIHEVTGISKERLGEWAEQESHKVG